MDTQEDNKQASTEAKTTPLMPEAVNHAPHDDEKLVDAPTLPTVRSHRTLLMVLGTGLVFVLLAATTIVGYVFGKSRAAQPTASTDTMMMDMAIPKLPSDATIIAQCTPGEGTQYISPKDIPMGPIYNVWENKVVGVEYMIPQSHIVAGKGLNLSTLKAHYEHVDVMYEAGGHAGLAEPHYHLILSNLAPADEKKITCTGTPATTHTSMPGMKM